MGRLLAVLALLLPAGGCGLVPVITHEPVIRNPFPQLSRVAITPFANLSDEKTVDTRQFALAYFNELQATPGFEVVPLAVVEAALQQYAIRLDNPSDARRLAQLLDVDAVVVGAVTEYSPYYPPRCGLRVQWYAANPCYHPIPPGYGLPWGTTQEEYIPEPLVYEAELALAREQLETQAPAYEKMPEPEPPPSQLAPQPNDPELIAPPEGQEISHEETAGVSRTTAITAAVANGAASAADNSGKPAGWPSPQGFVPPGPSEQRPACQPTDRPVLAHTSIYHGNDAEFTEALANYCYHRDEGRFGDWRAYLQRSDDFIRFCCHMHIAEMLSARGGAAKSRVVWRWPADR